MKCKKCSREFPDENFITKRGKPSTNCNECRAYKNFTNNESRNRIKESNREEFNKHHAEIVRKWNKNNPEKVKETTERVKKTPWCRLYHYKFRAEVSGINWNISDEYMMELFQKPCEYCGFYPSDGKLNGVDRMDNTLGYEDYNVCSCCEMCNRMKRMDHQIDFIDKCKHIATYNGLYNGELNYSIFKDYKSDAKNHKNQRYPMVLMIFTGLILPSGSNLTERTTLFLGELGPRTTDPLIVFKQMFLAA